MADLFDVNVPNFIKNLAPNLAIPAQGVVVFVGHLGRGVTRGAAAQSANALGQLAALEAAAAAANLAANALAGVDAAAIQAGAEQVRDAANAAVAGAASDPTTAQAVADAAAAVATVAAQAAIAADLANDAATTVLSAAAAAGGVPYWRLYRQLDLSEYIEFSGNDVLYAMSIPAQFALEQVAVWLRADATIQHVRVNTLNLQASFLSGSIAQGGGTPSVPGQGPGGGGVSIPCGIGGPGMSFPCGTGGPGVSFPCGTGGGGVSFPCGTGVSFGIC